MQKLSSVLLVDDDSTTNFLNQLLLNRLGVAEKLIVAENGAEALATLNETCTAVHIICPALILLDISMPVINGFEFLEVYQRLPIAEQQAIIIVMLTTSLHARDLARVQELPVVGVVNKPLTEEKVNTILRLHFQRELPAN